MPRFQIYERENSSHLHLFIVTDTGNHSSSSASLRSFSSRVPLLVLYFFARVNASFNAAAAYDHPRIMDERNVECNKVMVASVAAPW